MITKVSSIYEYQVDKIVDINKKLLHLNNIPEDSKLLRIYFDVSYRYDNKVSNLLKSWLMDMRRCYVKMRNNCEVKIVKDGNKKNELFKKVDSVPKHNPSYIQIESKKRWGGDQKIYKVEVPDGRKVIINHPRLDGLAKNIIRMVSTINYIQRNPSSVILIDWPGHRYRYQSIDERVDYYTAKFTKDIDSFLESIRNNYVPDKARIIESY
ncbi:hypothetical protein [Fodinibius sp.]|uniref:hypothetical protein n=1 Tax=Fodinibius sp. TaxID=1872440 RepID=UPI002ACE9489|nr:hypothetical protein [Fodinibius sp.]MDZ7660067.1 hypothetical protein [Fodinibius sp.]